MARSDTIIRTLAVLQALVRSRRGVALKTLAKDNGFPLRSLYRDVAAIQAAGFPVESADGRYWLKPDWRMPGVASVDADELLALFAARSLAAGLKGSKLGRALDRLWMKLASGDGAQGTLVPVDAKPWFTVRAPFAIDYRAHERMIATIEQAVKDQRAIRCFYKALSTGEISERVLEPAELHWDPGLESLYVVAWCRLRKDVRIFALHRFISIERTEEFFLPHAEATSQKALKGAFRVWRDRNVQTVEVHFAKHLAAEIRERTWSKGQTLIEAADGGVVLRFSVAGLAEVERWVMGYGAGARVLGPDELVARVRAHVAGMAVGYGGTRKQVAEDKMARTEGAK